MVLIAIPWYFKYRLIVVLETLNRDPRDTMDGRSGPQYNSIHRSRDTCDSSLLAAITS